MWKSDLFPSLHGQLIAVFNTTGRIRISDRICVVDIQPLRLVRCLGSSVFSLIIAKGTV